jgi:LCP family protein required for cell wall assembly
MFINLFSGNLRQTDGRTNILLLGMSGPGHEGPDMTDTIILASVENSTGSLTLISLPRDFWVPSLKAKVNSAFHTGFEKQATPGGLLLSKTVVSEITNQKIHYAVGLDFAVFVQIIDLIGGLTVDVPRAFDDFKYPIPGKETDPCNGDPETVCRYEHLHFDSGPQIMDGSRALKYIRSRQSADLTEGTDFARSRRQILVIQAVKQKLMSPGIVRHPKIYLQLVSLLKANLVTDFTPREFFPLARLAWKSRHLTLQTYTLTEPDQLYHPPISAAYDFQWVLLPKSDQPQIVFDYISGLLK